MKESEKKGKKGREMEERPSYYLPVKHSNRRRAAWHDYCSKSLYMLTYTCLPHRPLLSRIKLVDGKPAAVNTPLGNIILQEIENIPRFHPQIDIYTKIAMPDHIHFILYVKERLKHPLGMELAGFSKACNDAYRKLCAAGHDHKLSPTGNDRRNITDGTDSQLNAAASDQLFHEGFNDRIIMRPGQLETCRNYILDNPRRLYIKQLHPDVFRRYNHLLIGDREYAAYGNIFLLRDFERRQVVIHRADTPETRSRHEKEWLQCASNGGVLVSPFISADEKAIRDKAIEAGGRLIIIRNEGFEERFKPCGKEFDLCCCGRLLLLAPWPDKLRRAVVTRAEAMAMNALASKIAVLEYSCPVSLL